MANLGILKFIFVFMFELSSGKSYENKNKNNTACKIDHSSVMMCVEPMLLRDICEIVKNYTDNNYNITQVLARTNDTEMTKGVLNGCEPLTKLSLINGNLFNIEKDALSNMTKLSLLDLSNNSLNIYREDADFELILPLSLNTLKLNGNIGDKKSKAEHVKYPKFYQSKALRTLFIDGLPNKDLDVFQDEVNALENLTLASEPGYCSIPYVKETTFQEVRAKLKFLNISNCNITNFEFGALKDLKELEVLDLSYNRNLGFEALENISFGLQFTNIKVFNYSNVHKPFGKSLTVMKRNLCYLYNTSIEEFNLEGNRIDMFETNSFILLPSVKTFRIGSNRLTIGIYVYQIGCLGNLIDLHTGFLDTFGMEKYYDLLLHFNEYISKTDTDCPDNSISDCPFMNEEYLKNISQQYEYCIFVPDNKLVPLQLSIQMRIKIKGIFAPQCGFVPALISIINLNLIEQLETLDLSKNRLYKISAADIKSDSLKHLRLSENRCSSLDIKFGRNFPNLTHFYLQNNLLGLHLPDKQFESFYKLTVLNLSNNLIHDLPKNVFLNMVNLKVLDLSCNKIQKWTANVDSLKSLLHLNLSSNVINSLPSSLLDHFDKMKTQKQKFSVDLRNNKIQCSCDNKVFLHWIVDHKENIIGYHTDNQFYDGEKNLTVKEFELKVFHLDGFCKSYTIYIIFPSLFILIFLIVVFGGIIYKHRWQLRYFMYMTKRKYFSYYIVQEDDNGESYKYEAFISYAEDNADFVSEQLVPYLERHGLSLCVHQRDFVAGRPIIDNIINAVQSSRITLVVLSREFINSRWCMYEFQMARMESIYTRDDNGSLLIVMKDIIPTNDLPLEMMKWLKYESYLEYTEDTAGEQLFWERLRETFNIANS